MRFNPHPPRGGRLAITTMKHDDPVFQSTPPARGATHWTGRLLACTAVSIHTPREGGDIHNYVENHLDEVFQSTPPARGATWNISYMDKAKGSFNPHPPRGGRLLCHCFFLSHLSFNPHPPRGGRLHKWDILWSCVLFQSTPPARGATGRTHFQRRDHPGFNPHPPRGGRPSFR